MNSLINAASGVTEAAKAAVWGKPEADSGQEPAHEGGKASENDQAKGSAKPYDPGNSADTAPTSPTTGAPEPVGGLGATTAPTAVQTAIPAPGNDDIPAQPTEGAGATDKDGSTKKPDRGAAATKEDFANRDVADVVAPPAGAADAAKTPVKSTGTPSKTREESPASSTPGSGKKGLRSKLKERLHIGSKN